MFVPQLSVLIKFEIMSFFDYWLHEASGIVKDYMVFASLAFCVGWGLYHVVIGAVERFFG